MGRVSDLLYKIERRFRGERGIVKEVKASHSSPADYSSKVSRDYGGNLPQIVVIENPLGQKVQKLAPLQHVHRPYTLPLGTLGTHSTEWRYVYLYKEYEQGDEFPNNGIDDWAHPFS